MTGMFTYESYILEGLAEGHMIPLASLHGRDGSAFPGSVPPSDMVNSESVVWVKPGNSGVMIDYQVDEFSCTWSVECVIAQSHIYPCFTGKVSTLTDFPLEPGCEDNSSLDQAVQDCEHGL